MKNENLFNSTVNFYNINNENFIEFLSEFYGDILDIKSNDEIHKKLINELFLLYNEFNEKGIDEKILKDKIDLFLENNQIIKKLDKLKNDTEEIKTETNNISSQLDTKANKRDLKTLENRMDNFTKLSEGSTTGDAELIDGRVGASGVIYENMGDNIRDIAKGNGICNNVITPIKTTFIDVETSNLIYGTTYEKGKAIRPSDGTLYDVSSYQTTDYISCVEGQELVFSHNTNLCFFNEKTFVQGYQGGQWNSPLTVPNGVNKFRFCYPIKDELSAYVTLKGNSNKATKFYLGKDLYNTTKEKLRKDLNINSVLNGKKINVLGDSNSSLDYLTPNWLQVIESKTGAIINNYGVSGTTIAYNENRENNAGKCFANRVNELSECDITMILGGTNDVNSQIPLGNWDDTTNDTLYGAINIIITTLLNKFPGKPVIWFGPIQDRNSYKNKPVANLETTVLSASSTANVNYTLLNGAIKLKCRQYGIRFVNLYEESGINGYDTNHVYYRNETDTVHMSLLAHEIVANIAIKEAEKIAI